MWQAFCRAVHPIGGACSTRAEPMSWRWQGGEDRSCAHSCAAQHSRPEKLFSLLSELLLERHLDTPHGPFIRIGIGAQLIVVVEGQA